MSAYRPNDRAADAPGQKSHGPGPKASIEQLVDRNVNALLAQQRALAEARSRQEKIADSITRFAGSMLFVYANLVLVGAWVLINLGGIPGIKPFDPTFVVLAMVASVGAIFLSTFVLITQNRMAELADKRADLDLQISLLSEHELTQVIRLVREIADRMGIEESKNPELDELAKDVAPEKVLEQIESTKVTEPEP